MALLGFVARALADTPFRRPWYVKAMRPLPSAELRTDRFVLRSLRINDAAKLNKAVADSKQHLLPWIDWGDRHSSVENTIKELRKLRAEWHLEQNFVIGIFSPDEESILGGTGFHPRAGHLGKNTTEVGMWIHRDHAGKGLGQSVLKALIPWAFQDWGWQRLEWRCDPENLASATVAERCGFLREGHLRQHTTDTLGRRRDQWIYGLLASDVQPGRSGE